MRLLHAALAAPQPAHKCANDGEAGGSRRAGTKAGSSRRRRAVGWRAFCLGKKARSPRFQSILAADAETHAHKDAEIEISSTKVDDHGGDEEWRGSTVQVNMSQLPPPPVPEGSRTMLTPLPPQPGAYKAPSSSLEYLRAQDDKTPATGPLTHL